ncbi:MAG: monofunctional biosynthetic peptidoglycan transglycosylase [Balneola sp.]|nr:monofunctional biosynthetic peptidoglycan transglycosylase [Balneola sp.]|tara:strand:- start:128985 stop:129839 length:855 start_codon:yes stop_codon:yes gene_type:complete
MEEQTELTVGSWKQYGKIAGGLLLGGMILFCMLILLLRWVNPPFTAFTLQQNWKELDKERYNLREGWLPGNELPDHLKLAVIASEDQRFYAHWGLDFLAIDKALEEKQNRGRVRGASTITQQVAKNLFLSPSQTYFRKVVEAGISVLIEVFWTKERILEVYLNIAEFGPGTFGVNSAAQFYYGKTASRLTPEESARMATVLPNPKLIEPEPPSEYVLNRSRWILRNMEQLSGRSFLPKPKPELDTLAIKPDSLPVLQPVDSTEYLRIADSVLTGGADSMRTLEY